MHTYKHIKLQEQEYFSVGYFYAGGEWRELKKFGDESLAVRFVNILNGGSIHDALKYDDDDNLNLLLHE